MSEKKGNDGPYKKFAQGIFIVKSKNSSFNSDFSGLQKRLPDEEGTIYATDKALKYCIRKYLYDNGEKVFTWRRNDKKTGLPFNINNNYNFLFKEIPKTEVKEGNKKKEVIDKIKMLSSLLSTIDSRLFGFTYAGETNLSVTGSTQISYGINKLKESQFYSNQILSPYQDVTKEKAQQQTLGSETKTLEAHYVYDFIINPNNLISDIEFIEENDRQKLLLSQEDIDKFKEAICKGVNYVNSASKIGCEGELLLFIESDTKEDEKTKKLKGTLLPLMKDLIKIKKPENDEEKIKIDLSGVFEKVAKYLLKEKDSKDNNKYLIEIYYNPDFTQLDGVNNNFNVSEKNIITLKEIPKNNKP